MTGRESRGLQKVLIFSLENSAFFGTKRACCGLDAPAGLDQTIDFT
jgi:hypothetical protein